MKEKIFILVKTYPNLSVQYDETVCTAGLHENGKWVRIYPVPFRLFEKDKRYKKYQWVNVKLQRNTRDYRRESYRPVSEFELLERVGTEDKWAERRKILSGVPVYYDRQELIDKAQKGAPEQKISLAMFKPTKILNFSWEKDSRKLDKNKLHKLETRKAQTDFFLSEKDIKYQIKHVKKLPYTFFYEFCDMEGKKSKMMIEDWEIGALFWNCLKKHDERTALQKVKQKYLDEFLKSDLHLILGTTHRHHNTAPNPFVIIGVYHPPVIRPESLLI